MAMRQDKATVTLREVAARAGVQPSAVSNWRKRNVGFPQPVGSRGREEHFDVGEVDAWLRATGRLQPPADASAQLVLSKTDRDRRAKASMALLALYAVADEEGRLRLSGAPAAGLMVEATALAKKYEPQRVPQGVLTATLAPDLDAAVLGLDRIVADVADDPTRGPALFEELARQREGGAGGHLAFTQSSPVLGRLIAQLVPDSADSINDPALGEGGLLLACAQRNRTVRATGTEKLFGAYAVAVQRFLVNGIDADLRAGDALEDNSFAERFSMVVCEPPFGTRSKPTDELTLAFRGAIGASTDMQWVLRCLLKTQPGGTAVVVQPAGVLSREGGDVALRHELLRRGHILALIALPAGLSQASSNPLVLWVLTPTTESRRRSDALFVDLTGLPTGTESAHESLVDEVFPHVVADYQQWLQEPDSFEGRAGMSAAVPILDLLDPNAPLSPQYWVGRTDRLRRRHVWTTRRDEALALLDGAVTGMDMTEPGYDHLPLEIGEPPRFVSLMTLADAGRLDLIRGEPVDKSELGTNGVPVVTAASFANPVKPFDPAGCLPEPLTSHTRPGDVVFSPRGRVLRAVVDVDGGHSIAAPLVIVRPAAGDPGMSSALLAAMLSSERVQSMATGTTVPSVSIRSVTLPRLDIRTSETAAEYFEALNSLEWQARYLLDQIDEARDMLVDGLESGAQAPPDPKN